MKPRTPAAPPAVVPTAIYSYAEALRVLRITRPTASAEVAAGRLRVSRRAGRYYLLGQWLLDWIAGGVVTPAELVRAPIAHLCAPIIATEGTGNARTH